MRIFLLALGVSLFLLTAIAAADENWPQFRGPGGQGISNAKSLPLTWSETQNVKWKTPIHGKAWSSPVIWKNQIWMTTATEDGHDLGVVCVDKGTGRILIDKLLFHVDKPQFCIPFNSYASPTPCIEEGRIYVTFGSPGTACLDTADGKMLWQRTDFVCNHFRGAGSSPLLWNNLLFMNFDGSDFQYAVALDKSTGKTVWKTNRSFNFNDIQPNGRPVGNGDFRKAFSTPRIMEFQDRPLLISVGSHAVYCYEPTTGKEIWRTEDRDGHSGSLTPVIGDGLVYASTGHGASEIWAIKPDGHGVANDHVVWKDKKKVPTRSSPILVDGRIYMTTDAGVVSCLDAKTGEDIFDGRIQSGHDAGYSAAPLYAAGRIYFFNEAGHATVIEAGREFKILAENQLGTGCLAVPAVSGDALYLRSRTDLYCIETPGK
ncbi:MAG TPA: PQQ-binding-like beta-propeller repeat protein [Tepidisphaeraceae bacterium]|jgi:outer membrane protein assembly factor BamB|nr:PQQ-binding-like beta-propeller repeat protein [Tepidisphaeraceae bacterium]